MSLKTILLTSLMILNQNSFAESISINKGDKAPFDGILMDENTAKEVRIAVIENKEKAELIKSKDKIITLQDLSIQVQEKQINILYEKNTKLLKEKELNDWEKVVWMGLGILATSMAVYGASKLVK